MIVSSMMDCASGSKVRENQVMDPVSGLPFVSSVCTMRSEPSGPITAG